jgi:hypothetical protein
MRSDLLILLGGMALLAVLNVVFLAVILATLRKVSQVSVWPSTQGVVMGSSVEPRRRAEDEGPVDYPVVKYSYQVGGQAFQGSRIAPGPELSGPGARQVAARYATGASVTVFYNPQNPADAVLEKSAPAKNWLWFILVVFDCVICGAAPLVWWGLSQ